MEQAQLFFATLNRNYMQVHQAKEQMYWDCYMGINPDFSQLAELETSYLDFISDQQRLQEIRTHLARLQPTVEHNNQLVHGLQGWLALFEANILDNEEARQLSADLIQAEAALHSANKAHQVFHLNEQGESELASLASLQMNMTTNANEVYRKSSFEALQQKEIWVLENGFLQLISLRNKLARSLGYENFFEYRLQKNEQMAAIQLFAILDDFELRTRYANLRAMNELKEVHGTAAIAPWNIRFYRNGDTSRASDAYLPFSQGLARWISSFTALGIDFRGAQMQLDLCERAGKYENGFCHIPSPSYFDQQGQWQAAHINFTSLAKPNQVGSGAEALVTLFHEGGHAAHFANVAQNAPCFSQEYAPTSMAYCETQSMFCDSLLGDADWLKRYAKNAQGEAMPDELIYANLAQQQALLAFDYRGMALVAYFEAALYKLDDDKLTAEHVLRLARATETSVLGISASPRPLLSIPHLYRQESAASYHGYLLAQMAVEQTRAYFLQRDGFLTDNPAIGPDLRAHYWQAGNARTHREGLKQLTGCDFSAQHLADRCNLSVDEAWAIAKKSMQASQQRHYPTPSATSLNAQIRIVHGAEIIADNAVSDQQMCLAFETWLTQNFPVQE